MAASLEDQLIDKVRIGDPFGRLLKRSTLGYPQTPENVPTDGSISLDYYLS